MKVKLGEVSVLINGDRGKNYPSQADILSDGDIPFVNAGHLDGRSIRLDEMSYITFEKYNQLSSGKFRKGDILYCLRGSLGKKAVVQEIVEGAIASSLVIIRPDPQIIDVNYLMLALDSPCIQNQLLKANSGSSQPNLSAASVRAYEIDLPNKKVQEEIVNKFDKIQRVIDARKQQLQKLDELVKSRFVEMFGEFEANPHKYMVTSLQTLIDHGMITYHLDGNHGGDYPRSEEFSAKGVPYIGANCIVDGRIDFRIAKHLPIERANRLRKGIAKDGDVLFAHNATVGPVVVLETQEPKVILSTSLTAYRCNTESINPYYLSSYMLSDGFVKQYSAEMKQTTRNQVPITAQKKYLFMVPPIELQEQFAAFDAEVDKSKLAVQQSLEKLETLKKSLMQQYFG